MKREKVSVLRDGMNFPKGIEAFSLSNALSEVESKDLVDRMEKLGFEQALVNNGAEQVRHTEYRDCERCILFDEDLASMIWERIKDHVPEFRNHGTYRKAYLNECFRCLKYGQGHHFALHRDGSYFDAEKGDLSYMTLLLYLNVGYEGARTWVHDERTEDKFPVEPKVGMAFIFDHQLKHSVPMMESDDVKYCVRSDIMFTKVKHGNEKAVHEHLTATRRIKRTSIFGSLSSVKEERMAPFALSNLFTLAECRDMQDMSLTECTKHVNNEEFYRSLWDDKLNFHFPVSITVNGKRFNNVGIETTSVGIQTLDQRVEEKDLRDVFVEPDTDSLVRVAAMISVNKRGNVATYNSEGDLLSSGTAVSGTMLVIPHSIIENDEIGFRMKQGSRFLAFEIIYHKNG
mmetsp:Transcript_5874/g.6954  ORF Transcript_5874/g.6954 Transcript_5874/m.6954 type:complete len:401 (-) Transcript_5874:218-1420(-)